MNKFQKAAMFGLDARIALAIFGALSVITGASLYSAIQNSKATSLLFDLNEVGKAWEAYYIDVGSDPVKENTSSASPWFNVLETRPLAENTTSILNWNGPYINYEILGSNLVHPNGGWIFLAHLKYDDWNYWPSGLCETGDTCSIWSYMERTNIDASLAQKIDILVDGTDNKSSGNLRWFCGNTIYKCRILLKIAPITNNY